MSFNKIPLIDERHSDETRNIINLMVQVINNRGIEILSESSFLTWLDENGVKHQGEWDDTKEYDRLSVVLHEGNSYTSVKTVPVGIDILNDEFWVVTGNYNAQVENYKISTDLKIDNYKQDTDLQIENYKNDIDDKMENVFVNPVNFGLDDNADDNTTALKNALDHVSINGGTLLFPQNSKYKFTQPLGEITNGDFAIDLNGSTLDFSNVDKNTGLNLLEIKGSYGTVKNLISNSEYGSKTLYVDTSGLQKGDMIKIKSEAIWDSNRTNSVYGEINEIDYITSPTQLLLKQPLHHDYQTNQSANVSKINMVENVTIENGSINCGVGNNQLMGLYVQAGKNIKISNINSVNVSKRHFVLSDTIFSNVDHCLFETSYHENQGYGVSVADASSDCIISNNHFNKIRHSMSTNNHSSIGGIVRRILFVNNTVNNSTVNLTNGGGGDAIDTHAGCEDISIINNTVYSSSGYGINFEGRSGIISGNNIKGSNDGGIHFNPWADQKSNIVISNNKIEDVSSYGIAVVLQVTDSEQCIVKGNNLSSRGNAIRVEAKGDQKTANVIVSNNVVETKVTNVSINIINIKNFNINSNNIVARTVGIMTLRSEKGMINNNLVDLMSTTYTSKWAIRIEDTVKTFVNGNSLTDFGHNPDGPAGHGISTTATSNDNTFTNNVIYDFATGVYIHSSTTGNTENNNIRI